MSLAIPYPGLVLPGTLGWFAAMSHLKRRSDGHLMWGAGGHLVNECPEEEEPVPCTTCAKIASATITISGVTVCGCAATSPTSSRRWVGPTNTVHVITGFGTMGSGCGAVLSLGGCLDLWGNGSCSGSPAATNNGTVSLIYASGFWSLNVNTVGDYFFAGSVASATLCTSSSFTINNNLTFPCHSTSLTDHGQGGSATVSLVYAP